MKMGLSSIMRGTDEKKYFIANGENCEGPFSRDKMESFINEERITQDSQINIKGEPDWKKAWNIYDLKVLFKNLPPPIPGGR
jgi:hypothetical protein